MSDTITITGNVATEPVQRILPTGVTVTTFRLASTHRKIDRESGTWVDAGTNWYSISTYRKLAEHAAVSLHRGDRVLLTGRLRVRDWENDARKGTSVDVDADAIGHDLRWGVSTFVKNTRPAAPAPESPVADRWATPGAEPEPTGEWPVTAIPASSEDPDSGRVDADAVASVASDPVPF